MAAPGLTITYPSEGFELHGSETLTVAVTNTGTGILGVLWRVDGVVQGEFLYAPGPYSHVLDTTTLSEGPHTITVAGVDLTSPGQESVATVHVTVNNTNPSPRLTIVTPPDGARVNGNMLVTWDVLTFGAPIWFVGVHLDDPNAPGLMTVYEPTRSFTLDTRTISDGDHTLYLVAQTTDLVTPAFARAAVHFSSRNPPAHPPISRYGTFRTPHDITTAVIERLRDWQAEYTRVVGTAKLVNLKPLRAVIPMTDLQRYPENKLPCAVVVVGPTNTPPVKNEKGYYSATYSLVVGVVASTTSEEDTRRAVELYGQVVKMCLGQRRKLADGVVVEAWTGESTDPLQVTEKRRLLVHTVAFNVRLDDTFSWKEGPGPTAEPPAPAEPPLPEWPPVIWTETDLTIQKEPIT